MSEWISVKDRLPEKNCIVIACSVRNAVGTLEYFDKKFNGVTGLDYTDIVTHWMPLPEPPESEE